MMEGRYTAVMSFDRSTKRIWSAHRGSSINRKTRRLQVGCLLVVLLIAIPSRACLGKLSMVDCFIGACAWRCNSQQFKQTGKRGHRCQSR